MPVRLVAVDLDGTLVGRDRAVSPRTRSALAACSGRGILVVVVTARRWGAAAPLLRSLDLHGSAIVAGGGTVRDIDSSRVLVGRVMSGGVTAAVAGALVAARLQPVIAVGQGERHLAGDPRCDGPAAARYLARAGVERIGAGVLDRRPATRVFAMGSRSRVMAAARACVGIACRLTVQPSIVPLDNCGERAMEFHASAADKGDALRDLCLELGVRMTDTLAVGDAPGDLPMLAVAGIPVVMGQAEAGMRRRGFVVAPDVDADGAAWAIERFALR